MNDASLSTWSIIIAGACVWLRLRVLDPPRAQPAIGAGGRWFRIALPPCAVLAAPAIFGAVQDRVSPFLQRCAAGFSQRFCVSCLSGRCERDGYVLRLDAGRPQGSPADPIELTIAPECGGYRSLCGLSLVAALFIGHPGVSKMGKALLGAAAGALAIGLNFLRLAATLWLYDTGHARLARGAPHAVLGQVVLAIGVVFLFVLFRMLVRRRCQR